MCHFLPEARTPVPCGDVGLSNNSFCTNVHTIRHNISHVTATLKLQHIYDTKPRESVLGHKALDEVLHIHFRAGNHIAGE